MFDPDDFRLVQTRPIDSFKQLSQAAAALGRTVFVRRLAAPPDDPPRRRVLAQARRRPLRAGKMVLGLIQSSTPAAPQRPLPRGSVEEAAIEDWQIKRDGTERGIVEITVE